MGTLAALSAGVIGALLLAGATFAATAVQPMLWLMILLTVLGLTICGLALRAFHYAFQKQTEKAKPYLLAKQEEISTICEKAYKLLCRDS